MGTVERREREKQRRRADILNTARELFFGQGFRDTTIDDIARSAELARGTIYLYFQSKEEIYATIMEEGLEILHRLLTESRDPKADPLSNLLAGHDAFQRFHDEHSQYYNVLMLDKMQIAEVLPSELKARLDAKTAAMADWIGRELQRGMDEGYFRPMPVREVAYLQMGMAMGFAQMMDKCGAGSELFTDKAQTRQVMHDLIAMGVVVRSKNHPK